MAAKILMVLDKDFKFQTSPTKFSYNVLVDTLVSAGMQLTKAHRQTDPDADIENFRFDGAEDLSSYDVLWLIGDAGRNTGEPDTIPKLDDTEILAVSQFMNAGGGVFATGDHDSIGAHMCGWLPRVRVMRKWFAADDNHLDIPPDFTVRNWPPLGPGRADTIQPGAFGVNGTFFENQSDSTPQEITPSTSPAHPILRRGDTDITVYPDHMHEGDAISAWPGFDWNQTLTFSGTSVVEFPTEDGHQERPEVIATGEGLSHATPGGAGGFTETTPSEAKTIGILSAYNGFNVGVGRVVTGSTFHHYVDLNLTGDPRVNTPAEIANVGEDAQEGQGFAAPGAEQTFNDIKTVFINIANWLARPQRMIRLILDRSTFGQDEVQASLMASPSGVFEPAIFVTVDGYRPSDFPGGGITTLSPSAAQLAQWAPDVASSVPDMAIERVGVQSEFPDLPNQFQRFTFVYRVRFTSTDAFSFPEATTLFPVSADLSLNGFVMEDSALIQLVKTANPFMLDISGGTNPSWLSTDLRVFPMRVGDSKFGRTLSEGTRAAALDFIRSLASDITAAQFESLATDAAESALSIYPSTAGGERRVYNFALARVRLRGNTVAADNVRLFFRIFQSQTTAALTYRAPGGGLPIEGYLRTDSANPIALPGVDNTGTEYISFPCFSAQRTANPADQTDPDNVKATIEPIPGSERLTFYGCLLDNNLEDAYLPPSPVSGGADISLADHLMGAHQCIVAQLEFAGTPIPDGANPWTSDKLSQRNVALSEIANPGDSGSRVATHTFEIEATPRPITDTLQPDELMLEWKGWAQPDAYVTLYVPTWSADEVCRLADKLYARHNLRVVDAHTVECPAGGTRYIPIPKHLKRQVGLLSVQFPEGVKKGQRFDVLVRQVTDRIRRVRVEPPIYKRIDRQEFDHVAANLRKKPRVDIAVINNGYQFDNQEEQLMLVEIPGAQEAAEAAANPWREVTGAFQLAIPVDVKKNMLIPNLRLLSVLYWRARKLRPENRWYKVFLRYVDMIADKVRGLGADPLAVPATPDGNWPGLLPDKPDANGSDDSSADDSPLPEYGGWDTPDKDGEAKPHTGKISGLLYDHFGDFEGFTLEMHQGTHYRYRSREQSILDLVREAWRERYVVTVLTIPKTQNQVQQVIIRGYQ